MKKVDLNFTDEFEDDIFKVSPKGTGFAVCQLCSVEGKSKTLAISSRGIYYCLNHHACYATHRKKVAEYRRKFPGAILKYEADSPKKVLQKNPRISNRRSIYLNTMRRKKSLLNKKHYVRAFEGMFLIGWLVSILV